MIEDISRIRHLAQNLEQDGFGLRGNPIDFPGYMITSPAINRGLLRDRTSHLIAGNRILSRDNPFGIFADHRRRHIDDVISRAEFLLREVAEETSDDETNVAIAIAALHDIGNNASRENHSGKGAAITQRRIFSRFDPWNDMRAYSILWGIYFHDETTGQMVSNFATDIAKGCNAKAIIAVIAADKMSMGRFRLSSGFLDGMPKDRDGHELNREEVVELIPHVIPSLYARNTRFLIDKSDPEAWKATFEIEFSAGIDQDLDPETRKKVELFRWKEDKPEMWVLKKWYERWRDEGHSYAESYLNFIMDIYSIRWAMMNSCLFALDSRLQTLTLQVADSDLRVNRKVSVEFGRDTWMQTLFFRWKQTHKEEYRQEKVFPPPILERGRQLYEQRKAHQRNGGIITS